MADGARLPDLLASSAERYPDATAVIHRTRTASYAELKSRADAVCGWLRARGLGSGERVALVQDDPVAYIACYFGALQAGAIVVPLQIQTTPRSLEGLLRDCEAAFVVMEPRHAKQLAELEIPSLRARIVANPPEPPSDLVDTVDLAELWCSSPGEMASRGGDTAALILYTSGTTGEPKGVTLSHDNLLSNTESIVGYLRLTERDRVMDVLPLSYSYGNSLLLTHIAVGGSIVVNRQLLYPNAILDEIAAAEVTGLAGVPSTFAILLERSSIAERQLPSLRYVTQAGGPMPAALTDRLLEALPGVELFLMYGQTEASARLTYLPPPDLVRKRGSVGKPIPGVTIEICDETGAVVNPGEVGEIVAEGRNIMLGYWQRPEDTSRTIRDGKLWTGDLARMDDEGYIYIVGRKREMIKSASHRIAPREIEEVLQEHPSVHLAAVIGVPDPLLGEAIQACVVLRERASEKDLLDHCRTILPAYKVPHRVRFYDDLPKTASGKIRKSELAGS